MKQILQSLSSGSIEVAELPAPLCRERHLLVDVRSSLLSAGTERMLLEFGRANLLGKALQQPARVKDVLQKMRADGILATIETVRSKLDQPVPLGYCSAGVVGEIGSGVTNFAVGDRVISNGPHAAVVCVPQTLCARIPDGVSFEHASFTPLGAIALQGVRLAAPTLGERVVVVGLGLIGLMAVQILRASGCQVLGIDFDPAKLALAERFGAETVNPGAGADPVAAAQRFSGGRGVDAVLVTASTASSQPITNAAHMSRKRGRIVLVGVTGLELNRADFYEKELSFQVSCSYGPGRYDPEYEDHARDYPFGFVRWTEQRNFEAVLELMADGRLDVGPLVSLNISIDEAETAYERLLNDKSVLGIVLNYSQSESSDAPPRNLLREVPLFGATRSAQPSSARLAMIGAGNYASRILIPAFKAAGATIATVVSQNGLSSVVHGRKMGAEAASTDVEAVYTNKTIDAVVIATRHDSHADLAERALKAGQSLFVEKPLALNDLDLDRISDAFHAARAAAPDKAPLLMVGFNRRFAPLIQEMKRLADQLTSAKTLIMTVNAGAIPADHWTQNATVGGGRIVGEACHFIDLMRFIVGAPIIELVTTRLGVHANEAVRDDKATLTLRFADGSHGTIHYFANGSKSFPKERIELFGDGRILQFDNYRRLTGYGWPGFKVRRSIKQDKGQKACAAAFVSALRDGSESPIPFDELIEVSRWSIAAARFDDGSARGS